MKKMIRRNSSNPAPIAGLTGDYGGFRLKEQQGIQRARRRSNPIQDHPTPADRHNFKLAFRQPIVLLTLIALFAGLSARLQTLDVTFKIKSHESANNIWHTVRVPVPEPNGKVHANLSDNIQQIVSNITGFKT
jgi:hypothetical protein